MENNQRFANDEDLKSLQEQHSYANVQKAHDLLKKKRERKRNMELVAEPDLSNNEERQNTACLDLDVYGGTSNREVTTYSSTKSQNHLMCSPEMTVEVMENINCFEEEQRNQEDENSKSVQEKYSCANVQEAFDLAKQKLERKRGMEVMPGHDSSKKAFFATPTSEIQMNHHEKIAYFNSITRQWLKWEERKQTYGDLSLKMFLFDPTGIQVIPQPKRFVQNGYSLHKMYCGQIKINEKDSWNEVRASGQTCYWRNTYDAIVNMQNDQKKRGWIEVLNFEEYKAAEKKYQYLCQ